MIPRGTIVAALLVVELAIIGEAVVALRGSQAAPSLGQRTDAAAASGPHLVEGGPHRIFDAGAHPALTVDIGYADLTIVTNNAAHIDVSATTSAAFGMFRATAPITVGKDGETIRIAVAGEPGWSAGDDRMVTVVVPPQTAVTVVNAGDIKADGLRAAASLRSIGSGSVTVDDYAAPSLQVASSNGRIVLHQIVAPRLDATSGGGRVEGTALQVRDGSVESDGRVTLGFATGADTLVTAQTSNGSVNVSGFSGAASLETQRKDSEDDSSSQTLRVGAGNGRLDIHSRDGNINLARDD